MIEPQLSNWCIAAYFYWCHIKKVQKKTACEDAVSVQRFEAKRFIASAAFRGPCAAARAAAAILAGWRPAPPTPDRCRCPTPSLSSVACCKLAGFAFIERLLAQFAVRALPLERRIAERPVQRMIGNQAVERQSNVVPVARPAIVFRRANQLPHAPGTSRLRGLPAGSSARLRSPWPGSAPPTTCRDASNAG